MSTLKLKQLGGNDVFYIDDDEKVGLKTATPSNTLDVYGTVRGSKFVTGVGFGWGIVPIGGLIMWSTNATIPGSISSIPDGWLECDGAAVSRVTYSELFTIMGTTFGNGDGTSTFNVPDFRGRCPIGIGTGPVIGTSPALTTRNIAERGGFETHNLMNSEIPSHNHSNNNDGSHGHSLSIVKEPHHKHTINVVGNGPHTHNANAGNQADHTHVVTGGDHNHIATAANHNHGGNTAYGGAHKHYDYVSTGDGGTNHWEGGEGVGDLKEFPLNAPANGFHSHSLNIDQSAVAINVQTTNHGHGVSIQPNHNHNIDLSFNGGHTHTATNAGAGSHTHNFNYVDHPGHNHNINFTGGTQSHNNMQPYIVLRFLIRAV